MIQNSADKLSTQKALMTQPIWSGFDTGAAAVNQPENVLLHAGPAFDTVAQITIPIMNSACVAAVYEGLATNIGSFAPNLWVAATLMLAEMWSNPRSLAWRTMLALVSISFKWDWWQLQ